MDVLSTLTNLIKSSLGTEDGALPVPIILDELGDRLNDLSAVGFGTSGNGLEDWLAKFRSIVGNVEARETLAIRVVQVNLPRVAEALAFAGVIKGTWRKDEPGRPYSFSIDWRALEQFAMDPAQQLLVTLLNRAPSIEDVKAVQALLLLLATAPRELVAREYASAGFLALPIGNGVSLDDLTDLVNSPIAVPLGTELVQMMVDDSQFVHWLGQLKNGAGFPKEGSPRLAILGPDVLHPSPLDELQALVQAPADFLREAHIVLPGGWEVRADAKGSGDVNATVKVAGGAFDQSTRSSTHVRFLIGMVHSSASDAFLFGNPSGTFVAVRNVQMSVSFSPVTSEPLFSYGLHLDGVRVGVGTDLLRPLAMGLSLPGSLTFDSDLHLPFEEGEGSRGNGVAGLALARDIPKHLGYVLGGSGLGLWLDDVLLRIEVRLSSRRVDFRFLFRFDARAEIGPLKASMRGGGVWIGRWNSGNAGVLEPTGIGLSLDAGPISGGGFFGKLGPGEYGGALNLKILGIGAFAFGIYKELLGGGVSFVAVIGLRLPPPGIQVGFGFAISGFGGLIGLHRRADTDRLRDALVSGTAGDVLFTDDPTKNAPRILGELRRLFPDEQGIHVFGPTVQLNWLYLVKLDLGVFIELPGPRKIFLAGSGRLVVGSEDFALVYFRLDFIGGVDLTASLLFFDGVLVNSSILGVIRITGGVAFRLGIGANPYFMFSIGGFHPAFDAAGIAVPRIQRAGAAVDLGVLWFRQETYFAVTSNTVQFGARTEAGVNIGPIAVHGWFGFDALVQFKPFFFTAAVDAGMAATFEGVEFASIRVRGQLSGPGPLVLNASASVRVLVKVSKSVTVTIDDTPAETLPTITNLAAHLKGEIAKPANIRGDGSDSDVVYQPADGKADTQVPVGRVVWEQKRVPLDRLLEKVEGCPLDPLRTLAVECGDSSGTLAVTVEDDLFALGSFAHTSDGEALSAPTFSPGRSGFRLALAQDFSMNGHTGDVDLKPTTSVLRLPGHHRFESSTLQVLHAELVGSIGERLAGATISAGAPEITLTPEPWVVVGGARQHAADAILAARHDGMVAMPVSTPVLSLDGVM